MKTYTKTPVLPFKGTRHGHGARPKGVTRSQAGVGPALGMQGATLVSSRAGRHGALGLLRTAGQAPAAGTTLQRGPTRSVEGAMAPHGVDAGRLKQELWECLPLIPELKVLAGLANQAGFQLWCLGGLAGNLLHHHRQRLCQRDGDRDFRADSFEGHELPRILNVQTQDLDLVITRKDGTPETLDDIIDFNETVSAALPGLDVDVRGLKTGKDNIHLPLLHSEDFLAQHHNTVDYLMVQLNARTVDEVVMDLADWRNPLSQNLTDTAAGVIRFFHSDRHDTTDVATEGHSPEMKHVMRCLIKAARYDARLDDTSLRHMKEVVQRFSPNVVDTVVSQWFEKNAAKLALDAINLPQIWDTLDHLGLREKLQHSNLEGLSQLFAREPLPATRAGTPTGKTAGDLGLDFISHGTDSLELWNAICRTPYQKPNLFESREDAEGERALLGKGVYAVEGKEGLGSYNVVLRLDPSAQEGVDFSVYTHNAGGGALEPGKRWLVVHNTAMISLAPVDLSFNTQDMIHELLNPESLKRKQVRDFYTAEMQRRLPTEEDRQLYARVAGDLLDRATPETGLQVLGVIASVPGMLAQAPLLVDKIVSILDVTNVHLISPILRAVGPCAFSRALLTAALDSPLGDNVAFSLSQYFFPQVAPEPYRKELWHLMEAGDRGVHCYLANAWSALDPCQFSQRLPDVAHLGAVCGDVDVLTILERSTRAAAEAPSVTAAVGQKLRGLAATLAKLRSAVRQPHHL